MSACKRATSALFTSAHSCAVCSCLVQSSLSPHCLAQQLLSDRHWTIPDMCRMCLPDRGKFCDCYHYHYYHLPALKVHDAAEADNLGASSPNQIGALPSDSSSDRPGSDAQRVAPFGRSCTQAAAVVWLASLCHVGACQLLGARHGHAGKQMVCRIAVTSTCRLATSADMLEEYCDEYV